jgi:hypothetical protein
MECADPKILDHFAINPRTQLTLFNRRQRAPGLTELTLGKPLRQKQLEPLLHLARGFVGKRDRQQLGRIYAVMTNEMSDAVS